MQESGLWDLGSGLWTGRLPARGRERSQLRDCFSRAATQSWAVPTVTRCARPSWEQISRGRTRWPWLPSALNIWAEPWPYAALWVILAAFSASLCVSTCKVGRDGALLASLCGSEKKEHESAQHTESPALHSPELLLG